jgi:hypothetical protein
MPEYFNNMDTEQQMVFDAVCAASTKEEAANALGISRATLYRRLQEVEIKEALQHARSVALQEATASLQKLANEAAITLSVIMQCKEAPYSSRVAAASKLLDLAYRSYELEEVAGQIEELKGELAS